MEEAVNEERARLLVEFVFYWQTALRDLDEGVDLVRRVRTGGDETDVHSPPLQQFSRRMKASA